MRIDSIHIADFLGLRAVTLRNLAPVVLCCGANGAGKSSLRDAVALALTADLGRVSLKKEAGQLVRAGAQVAVCCVTDSDGDEHQVMIKASGQITDGHKGREADPALQFAFDGQRFSRLPADERRAFLFRLMSVKTDAQEITHLLLARQLDKARVDRIVPLLRSGFEAAEAEARRKVTEARGAWKAITGEAYGSEKAKTWKAAVPPYDAAAAARLATELQHADVAIGKWQEQIGKLAGEEQRRQGLRAKLPALQEHAAKLTRLRTKLDTDDASMQAAQQELARVSAAAGAVPRVGLVHELAVGLRWALQFAPEGVEQHNYAVGALGWYEQDHGPIDADEAGDQEARAKLPDLQAQLDLMQRAVANDKRDLAAAQAAHDEAKRIAAELDEVFDAAALVEAREQVDKLKASRAATAAETDKLRSVKAVVEAADEKTRKAAQHAVDVLAWDAIADQLAPSGIPGDLLREALAPIEERLAQHATDTGWQQVRIHGDMRITAGDRDYRLLSESERWRCDAMLAEAIAHLSGCRLLVLDRGDVLDLRGRSELLGWLSTLADLGEVDSVLLFMTLKAEPTQLPTHVEAHWIDAGTCVETEPATLAA